MKAVDRRAAIIAAGRRLAHGQGISATTYGDVAAAVGVTRGLVYHYFPTRDSLIDAVLGEVVDDMVARFDQWDAHRSRGHVHHTAVEWVALLRELLFPDPPLIPDMDQPENARFHVRLTDRVVDQLADEFIRTTLASYMSAYGPPVAHLRDACLVLLHGVVDRMRLHPEIPDVVLADIVYQSLHLRELTLDQLARTPQLPNGHGTRTDA
jgi:AcrR family transcriptional regulator